MKVHGEVEAKPQSFLTTALAVVEWPASHPRHFKSQEESQQSQLNRRLHTNRQRPLSHLKAEAAHPAYLMEVTDRKTWTPCLAHGSNWQENLNTLLSSWQWQENLKTLLMAVTDSKLPDKTVFSLSDGNAAKKNRFSLTTARGTLQMQCVTDHQQYK